MVQVHDVQRTHVIAVEEAAMSVAKLVLFAGLDQYREVHGFEIDEIEATLAAVVHLEENIPALLSVLLLVLEFVPLQ